MLKYLTNEKGSMESALINPYMLLLIIVVIITFITLIMQFQLFNDYSNVLDEIADNYLRKPMEENGGINNSIRNGFKNELNKRGIDYIEGGTVSPNKVKIEYATDYADWGYPIEVIITSEYEVRALAYIGGPILKRPVRIKKIGVSQMFFR